MLDTLFNWFESLPDTAQALFLVGLFLLILLISSVCKRKLKWPDEHEDDSVG